MSYNVLLQDCTRHIIDFPVLTWYGSDVSLGAISMELLPSGGGIMVEALACDP
jgi:hypothetical protein